LKPISLQALAREVCTLEEESYRAQGIRVEQDFPPDLPLVVADRDKLKQALLNLCKNAVEAMPKGGRLTLRAYSSGERLNLEIIDSGIGIPAGVDIFEPFTTSKPSGTGLGLVIVRQILVAHRGSIGYSSEPGKGTIFRLTLPSVLQEPGQKRIFQQPA
jgi:signal transduction histidine kinase